MAYLLELFLNYSEFMAYPLVYLWGKFIGFLSAHSFIVACAEAALVMTWALYEYGSALYGLYKHTRQSLAKVAPVASVVKEDNASEPTLEARIPLPLAA